MTYLLDTNAISDLMYEHPVAVARLTAASASNQIVTCAIVRGEILFGIARLAEGKRKQAYEAKATDVFSAIFCEPVSALAADHYARIKASQQKLGLPLDENDLWIASIAESLDATVVTRDSDMARVAGLKVIDWTR